MHHRHPGILQPAFLALSAQDHRELLGNQRVDRQSPLELQSAVWYQQRCQRQHFLEIQLGKEQAGLQQQPKAQRLFWLQQKLALDRLGCQKSLGTEPGHRSIRQLDQRHPWLHQNMQFQFQPELLGALKEPWSEGSNQSQHRRHCLDSMTLFVKEAWPQQQQLIHPTWMR